MNKEMGTAFSLEKNTAVPTRNTRRWYETIISHLYQPFKSVLQKNTEERIGFIMSNYIKSAFARMDIEQIISFVLCGVEKSPTQF